MKRLVAVVVASVVVVSGGILTAGAAHADEGWVGPFSSSWTCEQNAFSYGWNATCQRFDRGWYWWSPARG